LGNWEIGLEDVNGIFRALIIEFLMSIPPFTADT